MGHDNDEQVLLSMRTHPKALVPAGLGALVVIAGSLATGIIVPDHGIFMWVRLGCWLLCGIAFLAWVVAPVLRWCFSTFTVTTSQVQIRSGSFTRRASNVPLVRITNVETERSILDRIFGCGTLVIRDAGSTRAMILGGIPDVLRVRSILMTHSGGRHASR